METIWSYVFSSRVYIQCMKNFPIGRIYFLQSPSRNVWISRLLVDATLIGCLSAQTSVKLYRAVSRDLHLVSPQNLKRNEKRTNQWATSNEKILPPYIKNVSEMTALLFEPRVITGTCKPMKSISRLTSNPKRELKKVDRRSVNYKNKYKDCD